MKQLLTRKAAPGVASYAKLLGGVVDLLEQARRAAARSVNAVMTATYWEIGRRIVEFEQGGRGRAEYGEALLERLSRDLVTRVGRGFSERNLRQMRLFYLGWPIRQTVSAKSRTASMPQPPTQKRQTPSARSLVWFHAACDELHSSKAATLSRNFDPADLARAFPLPWSHYVRLLSVEKPEACAFYEAEALRGGWSVRQLDRQIATCFYERTALSHDKAAMLTRGTKAKPGEHLSAEREIKDPFVLEFLGLKDEYSESVLEEALTRHLEHFLLELGNDFAFVARQRRLRVGNEWYRIDLLLFHRRLRCLIVIDLKVGKFTHADAGQMNLYLNYAREHWTHAGENPPVGLILCAEKDSAVAHYALGNLRNTVLAREYRLALPDERRLVAEMEKTRRAVEAYRRS
jgi:predicted nuclease of restriction endonuclease-like (RecB) superfamily